MASGNITWKIRITRRFERKYGEKAEHWKEEHDDRRLFSNTYFYIMEALESLPEEPHNFICTSLQARIIEEEKMLDRIKAKFENK